MKIATKIAAVKEAYGLDDANKVLQVAKGRMLPRAGVRMYPKSMRPLISAGPTVAMGKKMLSRVSGQRDAMLQQVKQHAPWAAKMVDDGAAATAPLTELQQSMAKHLPKAGILPSKGNSLDSLRRIQSAGVPINPAKQLTPDQHRMLNSVFTGHEFDEMQATPVASMLGMGHVSPDVILREHNRLVTMPEGYGVVKDQMKQLRSFAEAPLLQSAGITYGQGERLSRHARKRITQLLEAEHSKRVVDQLNQLKPSADTELLKLRRKVELAERRRKSPRSAGEIAALKNELLQRVKERRLASEAYDGSTPLTDFFTRSASDYSITKTGMLPFPEPRDLVAYTLPSWGGYFLGNTPSLSERDAHDYLRRDFSPLEMALLQGYLSYRQGRNNAARRIIRQHRDRREKRGAAAPLLQDTALAALQGAGVEAVTGDDKDRMRAALAGGVQGAGSVVAEEIPWNYLIPWI